MIPLIAARVALSRIPTWAFWLLGAVLLACASYGMGRVQEARIGAAALAKYKSEQVAATVRIEKAEAIVVTKIETVYRDRIQKIYVEGKKIEQAIPDYVQPADDARFAVNAGFLRIIDGAWAGEIAGPAEAADREPSSIPLSELAAVQAGNITSCRAWRTQALGWRQYYFELQGAVNGAPGDWHENSGAEALIDKTPVNASPEAHIGATP